MSKLALFQPLQLKDARLRNRIAVAPMCQYMAEDGVATAWHQVHYPGMARGGAALVIVEATAVSPEGRITPGCLGLWNEAQAAALAPIAVAIKAAGAIPGIQLAHAGRKASANRPWEGDDHIASDDPRSWPTISPSAIPFGGQLDRVPQAMTVADIARVQADFAAAATRAREAGFEWLELHFAHGYLGQSFFSRHANQRQDDYGGDAPRRGRFLRETLAAVRQRWPEHQPLTARFGVVEFDGHDEETLAEAIELSGQLRDGGLDLLSVSAGFSTVDARIPWKPGFLAPYAARVRAATGMPIASAWGFGDPQLAEQALQQQQLDLVMIARSHLANPHWPYHAARVLGHEAASSVLPTPYAHWLGRYRD